MLKIKKILRFEILNIFSFLVLIEILGSSQIRAQVTPDRTLGNENSTVNVMDALNERIDGGARRGGNLFHSFQEFNINEGRGVYFANPQGVINIFSRVTGGNPSQILGKLGVLGGSNLFFLNPYGIIFGPNASLDIRGSFVGSTASGIRFGESDYFSATDIQGSSLLSIDPGVLISNQLGGAIVNRGNLIVGKDLTLSARNLDLQGKLIAGGNLTLEALNNIVIRDSAVNPFVAAASGQLLIQGNQGIDIFILNHPQSGLFSGKDLILRSANTVGGDAHYWSGGSFRVEKLDGSLGNLFSPHDPVIRANGDVSLDSYTGASLHIFAGGSVIIPGTVLITEVDSAENSITETVTLSDGTTVVIDGSAEPTLDIRAGTLAVGSPFFDTGTPTSANIIIGNIYTEFVDGTGGRVFLTNQYQPNTALPRPDGITIGEVDTRDLNGSGYLVIDARSGINLTGQVNVSALDVSESEIPSYLGNGGNVTLLSQGDILTNSSILAQGLLSGNVVLTSTGDVFLDQGLEINVLGGRGGSITINAQNVNLLNTSQLVAGIATGFGTPEAQAGDIKINATGIVTIADNSLISNAILPASIGNAGSIEIVTGSLFLTDGAQVSASTFGNGNAGTVKITASDTISLLGQNSQGISSAIISQVISTAEGNLAGTEITTGSLFLTDGAVVDVSIRGKGNAGVIKITASDTISLSGLNSQGLGSGIFSNVGESTAEGNLAGIEIITGTLTLTDGGVVNANTSGKGNAGAIRITASDSIFIAGEDNKGLASGIFSPVSSTAVGNSEGIEIITGTLTLTNGGVVNASTRGMGNAGAIRITASDTISIAGEDSKGFNSGIFSLVVSTVEGNSEGIEIITGTLTLTDGGVVNASTRSMGNAGAIKITASDTISIAGEGNKGIGSGIVSQIVPDAEGDSEGIDITTGTLTLTDGARIDASTLGKGDAGAIKITVSDTISLAGETSQGFKSGIFSAVAPTTEGNSEGIEITTGSLSLTAGAQIIALTRGLGTAGNITINANNLTSNGGGEIRTDTQTDFDAGDITLNISDNLTLSNSSLIAETTGAGQAGDITINAPQLNLTEGAIITAQTSAQGDGGSITVNAPISVILGENSQLNVETSNLGQAGNINITSDSVTIGKNAQISATATETATNTEEGGSITINASNLDIAGQLGIFAETQGQAPAGTLTLNPDNSKPNLNIRFIEQGKISASTLASGQGGDIDISAPDTIDLRGNGTIAVETSGSGNAGTINLNTEQLNLAEGVTISASTTGTGNAGNINLNATQVNLQQATVTAFTNGQGNAGSITVPNAFLISLDNSTISTEIQENGVATQPSNITLQSETLNLNNNSNITANSQGTGDAGNITLNLQSTLTSNNSTISTATTQASGGSIDISAQDIRLRGDSDIRTNVLSGAGGGGDITLTANSILAFDDSDILAFAQDGIGGNITLNTPIFFGNGYQTTTENQAPDNLDDNGRVDINASGAVSGVISVPDLTFIQNSLFELPETLINTENLIANSCVVPNRQQTGTFTITGSDGLPTRPNNNLTSPYPTGTIETIPPESNAPPPKIEEPQGLYRLPDGRLVLSKKCI